MTKAQLVKKAKLAVIYYENGALATAIKILHEIAGKEQTREPHSFGYNTEFDSDITVQRRIS